VAGFADRERFRVGNWSSRTDRHLKKKKKKKKALPRGGIVVLQKLSYSTPSEELPTEGAKAEKEIQSMDSDPFLPLGKEKFRSFA